MIATALALAVAVIVVALVARDVALRVLAAWKRPDPEETTRALHRHIQEHVDYAAQHERDRQKLTEHGDIIRQHSEYIEARKMREAMEKR